MALNYNLRFTDKKGTKTLQVFPTFQRTDSMPTAEWSGLYFISLIAVIRLYSFTTKCSCELKCKISEPCPCPHPSLVAATDERQNPVYMR